MFKSFQPLALAALVCGAAQAQPAPEPDPIVSTAAYDFNAEAPFASEIYNFFVQDALFEPTACRTVFTGSSSIRFWLTLEEDFPALDPLNRGFGGSQISDVIGYFDILLTRHQPKEIIFYAGENDINAGVSPADVAARFDAFMGLKTDKLGDAPVYFLSLKPSVARFGELAAQAEANALIADMANARDDLIYVDIATPMMEDGAPKPVFIFDQLHMNLDGYAIWTNVLETRLADPDRPKRSGCD